MTIIKPYQWRYTRILKATSGNQMVLIPAFSRENFAFCLGQLLLMSAMAK